MLASFNTFAIACDRLPCCAMRIERDVALGEFADRDRGAVERRAAAYAFTRLPSASRASTIGLLSSTRRPTAAAIRCATLMTCALSRNLSAVSSRRPSRST